MSVSGKPKYKESKAGRIPEAWRYASLVEIADPMDRFSFRGGPFGSDLKSDDYTAEGIRVLQLQDIGEGLFLNKSNIRTSKKKADDLLPSNIYPGDILLAKMAPVARCCVVPALEERYLMCSDGIRLAVDRRYFDKQFIFHALNSPVFRKIAESKSTGSTRGRIGLSELKAIPLPIPPLGEQQKIAAILTTVDDKLDVIARQIGTYHTLKQGLLQTLFSRGLGTQDAKGRWVPHTEFKDSVLGEVPAGWLVTTLAGICNGALQTGPFGSQLHADEYEEVGIPVLMPKDLMNCRANLSKAARIAPSRADELSKHKLVAGDLLFSRRGDVTRFALIDEVSAGALCGTGCLKAKPSEAHSSTFIAHLLQLDVVRTWLEQNAVGQTMPNMNTAILASLPLIAPANKKEQEEIAGILDTVDTKIEVLLAKKVDYQTLKRGLMQKLLSGEWRVTPDKRQEIAIAA